MGLRRALAVLLTCVAVVLFFASLLAGRIDATLLNPDFLLDRVEGADLYDVFRDEAVPALVDELVEEQEESLPENLRGADLPTDAEARARMAEVVQTFLPPEWLQATVEQAVSEVLPFMTGRTDDFQVTVSLHDPLVATFGAAPGERSVFEAMWLDLDMSERLIRGFSEQAIEGDGPGGGGGRDGGGRDGGAADGGPDEAPTPLDEPGLLQILSNDIEGAAAWWDEEFLGLIRGMLPYLVGDSDQFDLRIEFTDYPALAYAFAGPLNTDAETLQRQGWRFTDRDLQEKIAEADDVSIEDINERLAIFREGGMTFDAQDLRDRLEEQREPATAEGRRDSDSRDSDSRDSGPGDSGPGDSGPGGSGPGDLDHQRDIVRTVRMATTWGAGLATALLILIVAVLGGRSWPSRLRWGSAALLVASFVSLVLVTPVYAAAGSSRVDEWLDEQRADTESPLPDAVRERLVDTGREAIREFVGGMQWRALLWFVIAALGIALSVTLGRPGFRDGIRRRFRGRYEAPVAPATASADAPTDSAPVP